MIESECILWIGATDRHGYGSRTVNGKRVMQHRYAYMLAHGPIPPGMCVLHKCDTPLCYNTNHLFLGTRADNNQDCARKGRRPRCENHPMTKLTNNDAKEIIASGLPKKILAAKYGVCRATIYNIQKRIRFGAMT